MRAAAGTTNCYILKKSVHCAAWLLEVPHAVVIQTVACRGRRDAGEAASAQK